MKKVKHWFANAFKAYMRMCENNVMLCTTGMIPMRFDKDGKLTYGMLKAA